MRNFKIIPAMILLIILFSFHYRPVPSTTKMANGKVVSYFYGGKFDNTFIPGHYVKVFVDVVDQTMVVGFNTDNGTLVDFSATGTFTLTGRSVSNFYGVDNLSQIYMHDGSLLYP
jgi:hypothetical protein